MLGSHRTYLVSSHLVPSILLLSDLLLSAQDLEGTEAGGRSQVRGVRDRRHEKPHFLAFEAKSRWFWG